MRPEFALLITCEHGGNLIPREYRHLFRTHHGHLASHRGYDLGALRFARQLARATGAPLLVATNSRLLVDLNRSPHNPAVFSTRTRALPRAERRALLERYHRPHWERVRCEVERLGRRGRPVLHVAVHSFTPVLGPVPRDFELGLLYDSGRSRERALAREWQLRLRAADPALRVRRNAPYRGGSDGLTTSLRRRYRPGRYLGTELELNQKALADPRLRRRLLRACAALLPAKRSRS